jgi:hypothetical protein
VYSSACVMKTEPGPSSGVDSLDDWYGLTGDLRNRVAVCAERLAAPGLDGSARRLWQGQLDFYRGLLTLLRDAGPAQRGRTIRKP